MNALFVINSLIYQDVLNANPYFIVQLIAKKRIGKIINLSALKFSFKIKEINNEQKEKHKEKKQ